jgi:flavin-binding protein dodecin
MVGTPGGAENGSGLHLPLGEKWVPTGPPPAGCEPHGDAGWISAAPSIVSIERERAARPAHRRAPSPIMISVSVQKAIDLSGSGETIQEAVAQALDRARESLEGITGFEVQRISGAVDESSTTYNVELKVWFTLLERLHG